MELTDNAKIVLEKRYLLKNIQGKCIETPEEMFARVAKAIAQNETSNQWEEAFYQMMVNLEFLPNSPCLMNAGARLKQLSACFVLDIEDSLESIFNTLSISAKIHKSGGGTGFSFSKIRPKGDIIHSTMGEASGPVSFLQIFNQTSETIKKGGLRRAANMGVLRFDHPDILDFINLKRVEKMNNFNLSVGVTDSFMRMAELKEDYFLINPRNHEKVKSINAKAVFDQIVQAAWETGDPGLIYLDEVNRQNPTSHSGKIEATNPCGEVPLHAWESCNLGSINLSKFIKGQPGRGETDWKKLKKIIHQSIRFLDNLLEVTEFPTELIKKTTLSNRRIGLGIMGFADALILQGIKYNTEDALNYAKEMASFLEQESISSSIMLAEERGVFPYFSGSKWNRDGYKTMRNATVNVIAPTGTISIIAGCSSGIEPLYSVEFNRHILGEKPLKEKNRLYEKIDKKYQDLFITAFQIRPEWHIKMQAVFQKYTQAAVSKTINLPQNTPPEHIAEAYWQAWKLKCKGITVYRDRSKPAQVLSMCENC